MNEYQIKKAIHETKELRDILDEYQKTQRLLQEQRFDELQNHIQEVIKKHFIETSVYNTINHNKPMTVEQNGINCMHFLENLFKAKIGANIYDIAKYL